ncbi:LAME_0G13432g1_1 [Lachancea meyersii CBS 8951]|uniref:Transcription initiation factor TFIID subunit 8 n=1 Tax=Lachancea meyersii CBS 8951 TaxID=1266667 RepID=A0A1G4KA06_9SACH|nr:LAME_0G13432g1_1 [Lachancea meyersii CBS 8951]
MTRSGPDTTTSLEDGVSGVQLKNLPNLTEVPKDNLEDPLKKILEKAIAVQLKTIKDDVPVSQLAFENLVLLVEEALTGMLVNLHKIANIQRRHCISKKDLLLVIDGYKLTCADLMVECERSRFVRSLCPNKVQKVAQEGTEILQKEKTPAPKEELLRSSHPEFFDKGTGILKLVPPSVKDVRHVPKWLPEFPPDHTYRFTPLYNKPITDERQMKRKLAEESDLAEKALINFSRLTNEESHLRVVDNSEMFQESQEETQLIFKPAKKLRTSSVNKVNDLLRTLPQDHYNVEEYARSRVEITRRRVRDHERHQLQIQKGPFIRASHLLSPFSKERVNCKVAEKEVQSLLHRSYIGLLKMAPLVKEQRAKEVALAEENRRQKEEALRKEREERNKMSKEFDELDLNNLNEDPFFGGLGSSDSEVEPEEQPIDGPASTQALEKPENETFDPTGDKTETDGEKQKESENTMAPKNTSDVTTDLSPVRAEHENAFPGSKSDGEDKQTQDTTDIKKEAAPFAENEKSRTDDIVL